MATVPTSSQASRPVSSSSPPGVSETADLGETTQEGQNVFQRGQLLVFRIEERTSCGWAEMTVFASTANVPPGPWVGTGIAGTRDAVTGADELTGSVVGG